MLRALQSIAALGTKHDYYVKERLYVQTEQNDTDASDAQLVEHLEQLLVERLVLTDGLREWYIDDFVIANANHDVALSLNDCLNGTDTRATCQDSVVRCWAASALKVTENGHAYIKLRELVAHTFGIVKCTTLRTFRHDHDALLLRFTDTSLHEARQLVGTRHVLGNDGSFGAAGNG